MTKHPLAVVAFISCSVLGAHAGAQDGSGTPVVYGADFFEPFAPQTALDIAERVPGFTIDQGENRRGLGGAAGNVVIDGRAPASKGQGLRSLLRQIPAVSVERVELIRGGTTSASSGQSVLLNIVRKRDRPSGSGVWRARLDYARDGRFSPDLRGTWTDSVGVTKYTLSGDFGLDKKSWVGSEAVFGASGDLEETTTEDRRADERDAMVSAEITTPLYGGELILLGNFEKNLENQDETSTLVSDTGIAEEITATHAEENNRNIELSTTYSRKFGNWGHEWTVLYIHEKSDETETETELGLQDGGEQSVLEEENIKQSEMIARASATRTFDNIGLQIDGELAFNTRDQNLTLLENTGTGPVAVDLPGADTRVDESRAEVGVALRWDFRQRWSIETGLAYEYSALDNKGDLSQKQTLTYLKPSVQITRRLWDDDQIRARIFHDVSQLDLADFAAGVELENDNVVAGNADLRPETSWRAELSLDWRFGGGALEITGFAWAVEDAQDFVVFETGDNRFATRGNIGNGSRLGISTRFETPIDMIEGARISVEGIWQDSRVTDPLTGQSREQSEVERSSLSVELRQDIERYKSAWGLEFQRDRVAPSFRFDEITEENDESVLNAWVETTKFGNVKLRLEADGILGGNEIRERRRFDPDILGALDQRERRERDPSWALSFRVEGTF